jgi:hypothetical protein
MICRRMAEMWEWNFQIVPTNGILSRPRLVKVLFHFYNAHILVAKWNR